MVSEPDDRYPRSGGREQVRPMQAEAASTGRYDIVAWARKGDAAKRGEYVLATACVFGLAVNPRISRDDALAQIEEIIAEVARGAVIQASRSNP